MIHLRAPEPSDVDRMYIWENDPGMWRYGYSPAPLSRHQIWEYVRQYDANPMTQDQLRLIAANSTGAVGTVDLYNIDIRNRHAFVGIMIAREHRRKGYGIETLGILADYCRDNLGLHHIAATVASDNEASLKLFTKAGFTAQAVLPGWVARGRDTMVDAHLFILRL